MVYEHNIVVIVCVYMWTRLQDRTCHGQNYRKVINVPTMAFTNCTCSSPPNDPQLLQTEIDVIVCVCVTSTLYQSFNVA